MNTTSSSNGRLLQQDLQQPILRAATIVTINKTKKYSCFKAKDLYLFHSIQRSQKLFL